MYLWIFTGYHRGIPIFDRSMPRTCIRQANDRIRELKAQGCLVPFWTFELPKEFFS